MGIDPINHLPSHEQANKYRQAALASFGAWPMASIPLAGVTLLAVEASGTTPVGHTERPSTPSHVERRRRAPWLRQRLRERRLPRLPHWLEALITAIVTTIIALVVIGAAGIFWLWGATYTLQGIERGLAWLAANQNLSFVLTWWRSLGPYQWAVPLAFSLSEMVWAPIRRFLPRAQGPVLISSAIFSAVDIFTTHLGLTIRQPWRLLSSVALTFLPEAALLGALRLVAEAWLNLWDALRRTPEA